MALRWLGGATEKDLEIREIRKNLLGFWKDSSGSTYEVTPSTIKSMLSVLTTRKDGQRRFTKDLIDTGCYEVLWGRGAKQFLGVVAATQVTWRRDGAIFNWTKLQ